MIGVKRVARLDAHRTPRRVEELGPSRDVVSRAAIVNLDSIELRVDQKGHILLVARHADAVRPHGWIPAFHADAVVHIAAHL